MIPILLTVGQGLLWLVATIAYLALWGTGVRIGFHVGDSAIRAMQSWRARALADTKIKSDPAYIPTHAAGVL